MDDDYPDDDPDDDSDGDTTDYSNLVACLEKRSIDVSKQLADIDKEIKGLESRINQQFTDLRKYGYHIHSVFIHRGSVSFGHYWIYIYDFQKKLFRKYNDQYVTEVVDTSEVFTHSDTGPSPPTPYFLGMYLLS
jgi:ubiquitin carboxyl-terminal hydrolase 25/28